MKSRVSRIRRGAKAGLIGLFVAALAFGAMNLVKPPKGVVASGSFTITSALSDFPACTSPDALYPGGPKLCLTYTVQNNLNYMITVQSIAPTVTSVNPTKCAASNLDLSGAALNVSGALNVPAMSSASTPATSGLEIGMFETGADQDACQGASFTLTYTGQAIYTDKFGTTTSLTAAPSPSTPGQAVALTATVMPTMTASNPVPAGGYPSGTVYFYLWTNTADASCTTMACTGSALIGSASVNQIGSTANGQAMITTTSLPGGTDVLYAYYTGDASSPTAYGDGQNNFTFSTSPKTSQNVGIVQPPQCPGTYSTTVVGSPSNPNITVSNGSYFVYASGANYSVNVGNGNDCVQTGDGNNSINTGNGQDVVLAGNGKNSVTTGNGNDAIQVGNGTNTVSTGNGSDSITVGNGSGNVITAGNGLDTITVGSGSGNKITLGNGSTAVTVGGSSDTITSGNGSGTLTVKLMGSNDSITVGNGTHTVYFGSGTNNTFKGGTGSNVCHIPSGYTLTGLGDHVTNCTVVSP